MKQKIFSEKKYLISFLVILAIWLLGSQEIYFHDYILTLSAGIRYLLYFFWTVTICAVGQVAWHNHPEKWISQLWIFMYLLAFIIMVVFGMLDLFLFHFSASQKIYMHIFRLFVQSPAPFLVLYLYLKRASKKKFVYYRQNA